MIFIESALAILLNFKPSGRLAAPLEFNGCCVAVRRTEQLSVF